MTNSIWIRLIFSRAWNFIAHSFLRSTSNLETLCIIAKVLWKLIISWARFLQFLFANNIGSLSVIVESDWGILMANNTRIRIIFSWAWSVCYGRFSSLTYTELWSWLSRRWIIMSWSWQIRCLFVHNILSLSASYFVWDRSIFILTLSRLIFAWAWNFISNFFLRFSSNLESLCILSKILNYFVISRSRL